MLLGHNSSSLDPFQDGVDFLLVLFILLLGLWGHGSRDTAQPAIDATRALRYVPNLILGLALLGDA
jgi:hypothetical protein